MGTTGAEPDGGGGGRPGVGLEVGAVACSGWARGGAVGGSSTMSSADLPGPRDRCFAAATLVAS